MPFQYEREDDKRRIVFTFEGQFQEAEGFALLEAQRVEDVGSYGMLYDLRSQTGSPTMKELRLFARTETNISPMLGSRGAIAVVTRNPDMYNMVCAYAVLARTTLRIEVFRERFHADVWLAAQSIDKPAPME